MPVDELIQASTDNERNKVRLLGRTGAGEVSVGGFWIKVDEEGEPLEPEVAERLSDLAKRDRIPFVRIVEKTKRVEFADSTPEVHTDIRTTTETGSGKSKIAPWAFSINRGGLRYFLDFEHGRFSVIDNRRKSRLMSDEEFAFAKGIIEAELDPTQKENLQDTIARLQEQFDASKKSE